MEEKIQSIEAPQYISKAIFDDEHDKPSSFDDNNKIQTWNSQYYRGETMVVIANEDYVHQEQRTTSSIIEEKPLLLPVRSLTSHVSEARLSEPIQIVSSHRSENNADKSMSHLNIQDDMEENIGERLGSKRLSSKGKQTRNQESGGLSTIPNVEATETTMVHRSPIPWRTRSGRMVFEEDVNGSFPLKSEESSSLFKSLSSLSSRIDSNPPSPNKEASPPLVTSPRKLSSSPSWLGEAQEKRIEDLRKNSYSLWETNGQTRETSELRRSVKSVPMEFNAINRVEVPRRVNSSSEFRNANPNELRNDFNKQEQEKWSKAIQEFFGHKKELSNKMLHEKCPSESRQKFLEPPNEDENKEFIEKGVLDREEDIEPESDDDFFDGNSQEDRLLGKEVVEAGASEDSNVDRGPDVDKKADEFIAKFRQQIRLQRKQSNRLSSTPYPGTHSR